MPHYNTNFGNGYNYQGRGTYLEQTDTFEFADEIGGTVQDPENQPSAPNTAPAAPKSPLTSDSFFYADPPQGEAQDTAPTEMGDDFVI